MRSLKISDVAGRDRDYHRIGLPQLETRE